MAHNILSSPPVKPLHSIVSITAKIIYVQKSEPYEDQLFSSFNFITSGFYSMKIVFEANTLQNPVTIYFDVMLLCVNIGIDALTFYADT